MPNAPSLIEVLLGGGWLATFIAAAWSPIKDWRSGVLRKGRAEADAAEDQVPLTGAEKQVALAQQTSAFLAAELAAAQERLRQRETQLAEADRRELELRLRLRERDEAFDQLERQLDDVQGRMATLRDELDVARGQIAALRQTRPEV